MKIIAIISIMLLSAMPLYSRDNLRVKLDKPDREMIDSLRQKYYAAVENKSKIPELENYLAQLDENKPDLKEIIMAYKGGLEAVKSKHSLWPQNKLAHFKASMTILAKSITRQPDNLEIRFMRFSILYYVPSFLGHAEEREVDARQIVKLLLIKDYSMLGKEIQMGIVAFMIKSDQLTDMETDLLTEIFKYHSAK